MGYGFGFGFGFGLVFGFGLARLALPLACSLARVLAFSLVAACFSNQFCNNSGTIFQTFLKHLGPILGGFSGTCAISARSLEKMKL